MSAPDPVNDSVAGAYPNATAGVDPGATLTAAAPAGTQRYTLGDEIARGGMGVVYRAADATLGREVAVKVLQEKYGPDSGAARRFADEARIAGQLQHPAIPPVHDLGALPDGRPFLAMKLIKGATLDRLLEDRPDPSAERGRFVAVFEQVCQALAYAHSHNVIHRDLKPANIMVGAFGEVQVMDWGLAKVLADRPAPDGDPEETAGETRVVSLRDSDQAFTQAGSVLGTPAFMPPEQAAGAVGKVDARSDVFGLGAVLAVILTGKPPFAAGSAETVRVLSAQGKLDDCFARLDGCRADPELVALCRRCLSPSPSERPADAGEVARAVADLRTAADERARRAELERVKAEGEKAAAQLQAAEQKKRRRVQLALSAAVGLLLLGGGAFAWWSAAQARAVRERQERNAEAVKGLLDQGEEALRGGDAARAAVTLEAARKRSAEGGAEGSAPRLEALADDLALLTDLDAVDQFRWTLEGGKYPEREATAARFREALGRHGADPDAAPPDKAAGRASASTARDRIVAAWDWLLRQERTAGVRAGLRAVDGDSYRDAVRDAVRDRDGGKVAELAGRPEALEQPPGFTAFMGESGAVGLDRRRQLLQAALGRRPDDLGLLMALGGAYPMNQKEGAAERVRWYQAAVAAAPNNAAAHHSLGRTLYERHDPAGAEAEFRETARLDPEYAPAHNGLGTLLYDRHDPAGAEAEFRQALRLDPRDTVAHSNLGNALYDQHDAAGAEAEYREALRLEPKDASAHIGLGSLLYDRHDLAGAEAEYREAVRIDPNYRPAHFNLGLVLRERHDTAGAEAEYREAIRLEPNDAVAHHSLGNLLRDRRDPEGAEAEYREAIRIEPKDALAHIDLGGLLRGRHDTTGAEAEFREAVRLEPNDALAHDYLGLVLEEDRHDTAGAEAEFREAVRLEPKLIQAHYKLGALLYDRHDTAGAEAEYSEVVRLKPNDAVAHYNLGRARKGAGDLDGAEQAYREAVRLDGTHHGAAIDALVALLRSRGKPGEVAAVWRGFLQLGGEDTAAHSGLASALLDQGDPEGAVAEYKETLRIDPKDPDALAQLPGAERTRALLARLPEVLEKKAKPQSPAEACDFAELCALPSQKRFAAAVGLYEGAFAADEKLAADLQASRRYNAACYACRAAADEGIDAPADTPGRATLRNKALGWLRDDLDLWRKQAASTDASEARFGRRLPLPLAGGHRPVGRARRRSAGEAAGRRAGGVGEILGGREGDPGRRQQAAPAGG